MSNPKIVILVLVLTGLLFFAVLGAAALVRDDDQDFAPSTFFSGIRDSLVVERNVTQRELGWDRVVVPIGGTTPVEVDIPEADGVHVRKLRLAMQQGLRMKLVLSPKGDHGIDVSVNLRPEFRKTPTLQVFEEGATLEATCSSALPPQGVCILVPQ